MDDRSVPVLNPTAAEGAEGPELTASQHLQVLRIASELAALMDLPEDPRIEQAAHGMLRLFVLDGGMSVPQAIEILEASMRLTLAKLADRDRRH